MSELDDILHDRVRLQDYITVKDDIKQLMCALVSQHAKDQQLVSKLKRVITRL